MRSTSTATCRSSAWPGWTTRRGARRSRASSATRCAAAGSTWPSTTSCRTRSSGRLNEAALEFFHRPEEEKARWGPSQQDATRRGFTSRYRAASGIGVQHRRGRGRGLGAQPVRRGAGLARPAGAAAALPGGVRAPQPDPGHPGLPRVGAGVLRGDGEPDLLAAGAARARPRTGPGPLHPALRRLDDQPGGQPLPGAEQDPAARPELPRPAHRPRRADRPAALRAARPAGGRPGEPDGLDPGADRARRPRGQRRRPAGAGLRRALPVGAAPGGLRGEGGTDLGAGLRAAGAADGGGAGAAAGAGHRGRASRSSSATTSPSGSE